MLQKLLLITLVAGIALSIYHCENQRALAAAAETSTDASTVEHVQPALPQIPNRGFNLTDFGGIGDGVAINTEAFHKAIDKIKSEGGGRLIVSKGVYRTLPFMLCNQLDLHLDEGAVIQAPDKFSDFGLPDPETLKTQDDVREKVKAVAPLISGKDLHDVAITGSGVIDGAGATWWAWSERASRKQAGRLIYPRSNMVAINGCERLHIDGVTFRNSPKFHFVPTKVNDLLIEHVKVQAPEPAPNTDAIDPTNCTNVLIRQCEIDTGDDDIVIKSGGHNILIEDCRILHGHGISIGSGTTDGIHDMLVRRCTFDGTDNGIRIKSMRGAGGLVENIRYTDIQMKNVQDAIVLDLQYVDNNRPDFKGDPTKIPKIQNIEISNVIVESAKNAGRIQGLPESPINSITFRNVQITADNPLGMKEAQQISFDKTVMNIKSPAANSVPDANFQR